MTDDRQLQISLAIMRISAAAFFLVWSLQKVIRPDQAQAIASKFYSSDFSAGLTVGMGILQTLIILSFLAGLFKTWTYGILLGMHTITTLSTFRQLINPYESPNGLFWAAIPVLGALVALFMLRDRDNFLTFGNS